MPEYQRISRPFVGPGGAGYKGLEIPGGSTHSLRLTLDRNPLRGHRKRMFADKLIRELRLMLPESRIT
eukprot:637682-Rhodomonas_salina.1